MNSIEDKKLCIICGKNANATGSHIIPAHLIKNCVGKRSYENSFDIDIENLDVNRFLGRYIQHNELENIEKEVPNHYVEDYIMCNECEKRLGKIESIISSEFIEKFRIEKFYNNFIQEVTYGFETISPKKIQHQDSLVYFYSLILRYCHQELIKTNISFIDKKHLNNIASFINGHLYNQTDDFKRSIEEYSLIIIFDKEIDNLSFISSSNLHLNPIFYLCEAIVIFYKKTDEDTLSHFGDCLNFVKKDNVKIIIGPVSFIDVIKDGQKRILPNLLLDKVATKLNVLNNNSLEENRIMILKKLQLVDSHNLSDLFNVLKEIIDDNSIS